MKFRIKHVKNRGFYPQVKRHIFADWKRIANLMSASGFTALGAGLVEANDDSYPCKTREEALAQCRDFLRLETSRTTTPVISYEKISEAEIS